MKKIILKFGFLFSLLISSSVWSQDFGVWITTAHRIDFPKTDGMKNQMEELKEIVDDASRLGITTLYFQVRARGDASYQSELEPWSESFTGELGKNPGWDPLAEIIELAKSKNMKVIGWFNVFKVADQSNQTRSKSKVKHPAERHPDWILKSGTEKFLNPGIPEVRTYIALIAEDIVSGYNIDGLQLDFCRYPTTKYNDSKTLKKYKPAKLSTDDWRRQNVTETVSLIRDAMKKHNPDLILSAAPLGICKSVPKATGLQSYYEVYQDSYGWLENNLLDEVVPQLYWPIGNKPDGTGAKTSPDFETLCKTWGKNSNNIPLKSGIALYKKPVFNEAKREIEVALSNGLDGVVFFAWHQFKELNLDLNQFKKKKLESPDKKENFVSTKTDSFKFEKLTEKEFLIYNDEKLSGTTFEILDDNGNVISNGNFNHEHVVILEYNPNMKSANIKNSSGEKIGFLQFKEMDN